MDDSIKEIVSEALNYVWDNEIPYFMLKQVAGYRSINEFKEAVQRNAIECVKWHHFLLTGEKA